MRNCDGYCFKIHLAIRPIKKWAVLSKAGHGASLSRIPERTARQSPLVYWMIAPSLAACRELLAQIDEHDSPADIDSLGQLGQIWRAH